MQTSRTSGVLGLILAVAAMAAPAAAQERGAPTEAGADAAESQKGTALSLGQQVQQIQRDYERFEQKLLELGELMRPTDPDRAELLTRTRSESREKRMLEQMRSIARLLSEGNELGDAVEREDELLTQVAELLKLLQSEDARDRNKKDIKFFEELLKDTGKLIGEQKDARAATERGGESGKLEQGQQRVNDHAGELADKIDRRDAERAEEQKGSGAESKKGDEPSPNSQEPGSEGDPKPAGDKEQKPQESPDGKPSGKTPEGSESKPSESDSSKGEPSEGQPSKGQPSKGQESKGQQSKGQQGEPQQGSQSPDGKPQQPQPGAPPKPLGGEKPSGDQQDSGGQQNSGEQQESESQAQKTPGRQELQKAIEEMQKAIEELKQQNRGGASDNQDAAVAKLEQMKARLEEILRQLREEEREMMLTLLEARFQEMLRVQLQINAETERLDKVAPENRESRHAAKATDLARNQRDNALEADRALILLKEEGSSVAFPEAVEQMRDSMVLVAGRLDKTDTGETTQLIEQTIVETLDEMILALQQELEKMKEQKQQQQQQQQQQDQDQQLVNALAELKMIRSLQNQINRLTRQIGLNVEGEQAADPDNQKLLQNLAGRQQRVQEATYDLQSGKSPLGQELRKGTQ